MECNKERNAASCNCTYDPCPRKGICCECLKYHLDMRQLPGCCFPDHAERTYDRSFEHFAKLVSAKSVWDFWRRSPYPREPGRAEQPTAFRA